jgi:hypothetical protein
MTAQEASSPRSEGERSGAYEVIPGTKGYTAKLVWRAPVPRRFSFFFIFF